MNIANEIDGVTAKSTEVSQAIREGKVKVNLLGDELYNRYYGTNTAHTEILKNGETNIYMRRNSASLYSDTVHEGVHGIDMNNRFGFNPLKTTRDWEFRAYDAEREFQLVTTGRAQYPSATNIMNYINSNYFNPGGLFDPYGIGR